MQKTQTLRMYTGENRRLYVTVTSSDELPFQITDAQYEFWNCDMDMCEAEGTCDVDGHVLRISVCPARPGIYKVIYFLKIADETVICRAMINVSEA